MLQINWTANWRWFPESHFYRSREAWCVEVKWFIFQIDLYNRPAAELIIEHFNRSLH